MTKLAQSTLDAITAAVAAAFVAQAAIVTPSAKSPVGPVKFADTTFGAAQLARQAAKLPCTIHATGCNRRFSPASAGTTNHVAKIV